ncbi:hypothetical protein BX666DRAFT_427764 [Dichotomocladium elegans]|nr:hypothetical protein BX666DRAFT_427764 [Dichotomocladium elegans]
MAVTVWSNEKWMFVGNPWYILLMGAWIDVASASYIQDNRSSGHDSVIVSCHRLKQWRGHLPNSQAPLDGPFYWLTHLLRLCTGVAATSRNGVFLPSPLTCYHPVEEDTDCIMASAGWMRVSLPLQGVEKGSINTMA